MNIHLNLTTVPESCHARTWMLPDFGTVVEVF
jgi:hypothetical protein